MASKRLASKSSTAIDEILGISRSATATPYPDTSIPPTPSNFNSTSQTPLPEETELKLQELTTSSKSVMDYFREKLLAKSDAVSFSSTPAASSSISTTPRGEDEGGDEDDGRPRGGLGLGFARARSGAGSSDAAAGLGSSKLRSEVAFCENKEGTERGFGMLSRMSAMFMSSTSTSADIAEQSAKTADVQEETVVEDGVEVDSTKQEKKKRRKGKGAGEVSAEVKEAEMVKKKSNKRKHRGNDEEGPDERPNKGMCKAIEVAVRDDATQSYAGEETTVAHGQPSKKDKKRSKRKPDMEIEVVDERKGKKKKRAKSAKLTDTSME